ncbi:MAG: hypothetical protein HYU66_16075 [Armatimonadetes bacterium]|nr:hypothetical protein [Armatimonadota bacterium]
MPLPPPPDGVRAAVPEDFHTGPCAWPRVRIGLVGLLLAGLSWAALQRWGSSTVGLAAVATAFSGWLAAIVAQWINLRRDEPVVLTLAEVSAEETECGAVALWRFEQPVPPAHERREMASGWALTARGGDRVLARVRETGFGTLTLVVGTPTVEGWRLPPPQSAWPPAAQLYALLAVLALLAVGALALAPCEALWGSVTEARQRRWVTGLGQEPWHVTVRAVCRGDELERSYELSHAELLELLPEAGRRALAAPGALSGEERQSLWEQYLPIGARVVLRHTHLGRWDTVVYVGP